MEEKLFIYIISDSIGETAEQVAKAAISQFKNVDYELVRYPYITEKKRIHQILKEASGRRSVIIFTTVIEDLKQTLIEECEKNNIKYVDIMSSLLNAFHDVLGSNPIHEPGTIRRLDERYFNRVAAIEFAVKYDDGKDSRGIKKADIVLIGVSRTSKTPLSMYLAHKNIKVANVPLVPEAPVPDELFEIPPKKIIGLTANPIKLNEIRQERLKALGLSSNASYANLDRILEELDYAEKIMKKLSCAIIDVSNKAVEESASIIMEIMRDNNLL
ncbi:MAG: [pyruvate, water dikinase]-phosphate phosphotransferase / [pyruvate, water dikinase] kinase [Candidatus Petromonas sp.]|jgi:regulator of PEP synthase PpsR (kinase-PPPase family)|nr:[pyruvate, water dikinase]-phosphate phosphotransferase / [pyruvate, water dikinase] kinase [Candidatus Petromonas sp.]